MGIRSVIKKKRVWVPIVAVVGFCVVCLAAFLIYAACYYRADETALAVLEERDDIVTDGNFTFIPASGDSDVGVIFYPGGNVEAIAYLPILDLLSSQNINVVLVKMPLNFAVFNVSAADKVMEKYSDIESWYMCGHSLGGAMAGKYSSDNQDKVSGLICLGSYVYGDYPTSKSTTIYGSFNSNLESSIDYDDNIVVIEGGNHAQFGNYGAQAGDSEATISSEEQQQIGVDAMVSFISMMENISQ